MTIIVKFWVFTLGAISAIADTHLGAKLSILTFKRNNRILTIVLGVIFGTWFLFKALARLGLT
jgi:hypothetical protein